MAGAGDEGAIPDPFREAVEAVYRDESRRVLATLIRKLGDFDLAEEALHHAFIAAIEQWPREGVPANPRAWLVSVGRFKAIDALRRRARLEACQGELVRSREGDAPPAAPGEEDVLEDDRLRLIFTCCHPALALEAQVALTLRTVCGLTTEEIARVFLVSATTIAKRIVRAKAKIRDAGIPYEVPGAEALRGRLESVLEVVYLMFTEGYRASFGEARPRPDVSQEAIRLARLLVELLPEPETLGALALMLLHESRRAARISPGGELVLLPEQDRALWDRSQVEEGTELVERALASGGAGPYALQAAIAAVHARAPEASATDWVRICALYDGLLEASPSPVVALNRAVAIAMRDGPGAGLLAIDEILARGELGDYHLAHSARADFLRRLGRREEALEAYGRALGLTPEGPARRFLVRRMDELRGA
jgi:RNA polymerase sigma-70 factor (ECF subfamily)